MATLSWVYTPTKKGIPRLVQTDRSEAWKKGWEKIPGSINDWEKPAIIVHEYRWTELTDIQRTGIYNHTLQHTTNTAGDNTIGPGRNDQNRFIIQEQKGIFAIRYNGGSFDLYIDLGKGTPRRIINNRPMSSQVKMVLWLKRYAQYLIDEPDQLQKIIDNPVLTEKQEIYTPDSAPVNAIIQYPRPVRVFPPGWINHLRVTITEESIV
jgi:hypothetical protein